MNVDEKLIDAAEQRLRTEFPDRRGSACAVYSSHGQIITASDREQADLAAIAACQACGEMIAALVSLSWSGARSAMIVKAPSARALEQLDQVGRRHAQIAVSGEVGDRLVIRPLWELIRQPDPNILDTAGVPKGNFAWGMKAIGGDLQHVAKKSGVGAVRQHYPQLLLSALRDQPIRANAARPASVPSQFILPVHLPSVSLRHVWLAFERSAEQLVYGFIDSSVPRLTQLGCNRADVVHIKQGFEALRNSFAALVVFTGLRSPVLNECPFYPYHSFSLQHGVTLHEYVKVVPAGEADGETSTVDRNTLLVRQLCSVLGSREPGGFAAYLRQRGLFKVDLFDGGGPGHCPFWVMSNEICYASAAILRQALESNLIILTPDAAPALS